MDELERVKKMMEEGKLSKEEGEKVMAALKDKIERPSSSIINIKRLSLLAVISLIACLLVIIPLIVTVIRILHLPLLHGTWIVLFFSLSLGLSLFAFITGWLGYRKIRKRSNEFTGRGLALFGGIGGITALLILGLCYLYTLEYGDVSGWHFSTTKLQLQITDSNGHELYRLEWGRRPIVISKMPLKSVEICHAEHPNLPVSSSIRITYTKGLETIYNGDTLTLKIKDGDGEEEKAVGFTPAELVLVDEKGNITKSTTRLTFDDIDPERLKKDLTLLRYPRERDQSGYDQALRDFIK